MAKIDFYSEYGHDKSKLRELISPSMLTTSTDQMRTSHLDLAMDMSSAQQLNSSDESLYESSSDEIHPSTNTNPFQSSDQSSGAVSSVSTNPFDLPSPRHEDPPRSRICRRRTFYLDPSASHTDMSKDRNQAEHNIERDRLNMIMQAMDDMDDMDDSEIDEEQEPNGSQVHAKSPLETSTTRRETCEIQVLHLVNNEQETQTDQNDQNDHGNFHCSARHAQHTDHEVNGTANATELELAQREIRDLKSENERLRNSSGWSVKAWPLSHWNVNRNSQFYSSRVASEDLLTHADLCPAKAPISLSTANALVQQVGSHSLSSRFSHETRTALLHRGRWGTRHKRDSLSLSEAPLSTVQELRLELSSVQKREGATVAAALDASAAEADAIMALEMAQREIDKLQEECGALKLSHQKQNQQLKQQHAKEIEAIRARCISMAQQAAEAAARESKTCQQLMQARNGMQMLHTQMQDLEAAVQAKERKTVILQQEIYAAEMGECEDRNEVTHVARVLLNTWRGKVSCSKPGFTTESTPVQGGVVSKLREMGLARLQMHADNKAGKECVRTPIDIDQTVSPSHAGTQIEQVVVLEEELHEALRQQSLLQIMLCNEEARNSVLQKECDDERAIQASLHKELSVLRQEFCTITEAETTLHSRFTEEQCKVVALKHAATLAEAREEELRQELKDSETKAQKAILEYDIALTRAQEGYDAKVRALAARFAGRLLETHNFVGREGTDLKQTEAQAMIVPATLDRWFKLTQQLKMHDTISCRWQRVIRRLQCSEFAESFQSV